MDLALTLRARFFDDLFDAIRVRRLRGTLDAIQSRVSLAPRAVAGAGTSAGARVREGEGGGSTAALLYRGAGAGAGDAKLLYADYAEHLNIDFAVERIPVQGDTLDPRLVRIAPRRYNEMNKHAYETFLYVLRGRGRVVVDGVALDVLPGDGVLVPRWSMHQMQNRGGDELLFLAVTDFHFADKAFIGDARPFQARPHERAVRDAAPSSASVPGSSPSASR
jgi:mannose-6-phosphate isomerase-like protein (cupin superfamily)